MSQPLANYLITKRNDLKEKGYRVRVQRPNKIFIPKKNSPRDRMWKSENFSIEVESSVYFGMEFDQSNPLNEGKHLKIFKTGKHRYWVYNSALSPFQNIANFFQHQTY
jgi:hypothetical protein